MHFMQPYHYFPGNVPIIVSIPHAGTYIPEIILKRLTPSAQMIPDIDWHLERLYSFARNLGVHILLATHSRYVIDLNRAADDEVLYPGKFTTGLCPRTLFDGTPVYQQDLEPDDEEVQTRIKNYWQPYHHKLAAIINDLQQQHEKIILFDAHSIRSQVPLLFSGVLPDLNLGTFDGQSANCALTEMLMGYCQTLSYTSVCNGRFKGGYITRHYGNPNIGIHALQLEIAQYNYMDETYPFTYQDERAMELQQTLHGFFTLMLHWAANKIDAQQIQSA